MPTTHRAAANGGRCAGGPAGGGFRFVQTTTTNWLPPRPVSDPVGAWARDTRTAHCPRETGGWPWGNTLTCTIEGHPFNRSAARPPVAVSGTSHSTSWQSPGPDQTNRWSPQPRPAEREPEGREEGAGRGEKGSRSTGTHSGPTHFLASDPRPQLRPLQRPLARAASAQRHR